MQEDIWDFDEQAVIDAVHEHSASKVLLQFPDGIKPHALKIRDRVKQEDGVQDVLIWAGSNFGACDLPLEARNVGVDLVIHFGHAPWNYERKPVA